MVGIRIYARRHFQRERDHGIDTSAVLLRVEERVLDEHIHAFAVVLADGAALSASLDLVGLRRNMHDVSTPVYRYVEPKHTARCSIKLQR